MSVVFADIEKAARVCVALQGLMEQERAQGLAVGTCMGCHLIIGADREEIKKVAGAFNKKQPIAWVRVHKVPVRDDYTANVEAMAERELVIESTTEGRLIAISDLEIDGQVAVNDNEVEHFTDESGSLMLGDVVTTRIKI